MCAPLHLPVYTAPHPEAHAYSSSYFLISAAGHKEKTHRHMMSRMDFRFLSLKGFGYILYYIREHSIPMCFFSVLTDVSPYEMSACF